jgi:hypothetical protein
MGQHENLQELLTRLHNIRDSMEEALDDIRGIVGRLPARAARSPHQGRYTRNKRPNTELVSSH